MTTFNEMVDVAIAEANGYVRNQDSITVLTSSVGANELVFTVDDSSAISRGTVEIDEEVVYVKQVDKTYGNVTVIPAGRGWMATTASSHPVNTIVRNNPLFPRWMVKRYINEIIQSIDLYAQRTYEFTFDGSTYAWPLPAGAMHVTSVTWQLPDATKVFAPLKRWYLDRNFLDEFGVTTKAIVLNEAPMPGATVRVQYAANPSTISLGTDTIESSGLPISSIDAVRYGVLWKMLSTVDLGKVNATTVNADAVDTKNDAGKATNVARYMYQMYQIRVADEKRKQSDELQPTINYTR